MVQLVGTGKSVLELGAASGYMTRVLRERGNTVVAVESDASCAKELKQNADEAIISDLDWLTLASDLKGRTFDVIVAGDVLEHTTKSDLILRQLRSLLAPNGYLVLTLPHIAHGDVRLSLLQGEFPYSDRGLLDRTHLRFFTRTSLRQMLNDAGYDVSEIYGTTTPLGTTELGIDLSYFSPDVVQQVLNSPDSDVYQFVVKASPNEQGAISMVEDDVQHISPVDPAGLLSEISVLRQENRELKNSIIVMEKQLRDQTVSVLESKDYVLGLLAELGEFKSRTLVLEEKYQSTTDLLAAEMTRAYDAEVKLSGLEAITHQNARLKSELQSLYTSKPWKLGRFLTAPLRYVKKLFR